MAAATAGGVCGLLLQPTPPSPDWSLHSGKGTTMQSLCARLLIDDNNGVGGDGIILEQ